MGRTFSKHLINLKEGFQRFREANLVISPQKCHLFQTKVNSLGPVVRREREGYKIFQQSPFESLAEQFYKYLYGRKLKEWVLAKGTDRDERGKETSTGYRVGFQRVFLDKNP